MRGKIKVGKVILKNGEKGNNDLIVLQILKRLIFPSGNVAL